MAPQTLPPHHRQCLLPGGATAPRAGVYIRMYVCTHVHTRTPKSAPCRLQKMKPLRQKAMWYFQLVTLFKHVHTYVCVPSMSLAQKHLCCLHSNSSYSLTALNHSRVGAHACNTLGAALQSHAASSICGTAVRHTYILTNVHVVLLLPVV